MASKPEFDQYAHDYEAMLRVPMREGFVQDASFYHRRKWTLIAEFFRAHAFSTAKLAWLDVGCGKGELLGYGSPHFASVAGCDLSREMLNEARGIEVRLQKAPAVLPFPDQSFDFATAVCVYHHVQEPDRIPLTREIRRVLRPDGIFCMIEHNPFNPVTRRIVSQCPVDVDAHLLTARAARAYNSAAALAPLETIYFLYLPEKVFDKMAALERVLRKFPLGGQYATFARR